MAKTDKLDLEIFEKLTNSPTLFNKRSPNCAPDSCFPTNDGCGPRGCSPNKNSTDKDWQKDIEVEENTNTNTTSSFSRR